MMKNAQWIKGNEEKNAAAQLNQIYFCGHD